MDTPFWIDIDIESVDNLLRVTARGSRGEITSPRVIPIGLDRLEMFARKVSRAVEAHQHLDEPTLLEAQALHSALFEGAFRDLAIRLSEAAKGSPVLHRLVLRTSGLQAVPWEALCEPSSTEGFWSTSPTVHLARGVPSTDPWKPREVTGAVRLLVLAPSVGQNSLHALRDSVADPIAAGEIEWLEPIVGPQASLPYLFDALRRSKRPHILHFIGHGGLDSAGNPLLRLTDNEDAEQEWIKVESLARELAATVGEDLRLVVLEACEGARPGLFGSAAELFSRAGVDAVIAHLWPVKADVARTCSRGLYHSLTARASTEGNVVSSLANIRRILLLHGAVAFSPVLYLRGAAATIFNFEKRKLGNNSTPPDMTPEMQITNTTRIGGTQWLTGELVPIWNGRRSTPPRLRFDLRRKDGLVVLVENALTDLRTYYIGRKQQRTDKKTLNDIVLSSERVSQDAASIEPLDGRFLVRNTSDKPRLLVNMAPLQPGEARVLYHGSTVVIGDVSGVFLDGRFFHAAPATAVDPKTGLLSRVGLTCEVAVALATRKPRALLLFQFAPDDVHAASVAARALHADEPAAPVGTIDATTGMLMDDKSTIANRLAAVRRAGLSPRVVGFLNLVGPSVEAGARVEAALGALKRMALAGGPDDPVDLARFALPMVPLADLTQLAREARGVGGGMGLLLLDEFERYGVLGEAARAAVELELGEQLGAMLAPGDRIAMVGPGAFAVVTRRPVDSLLRDVSTTWRARGPIAVGALELDRGLRVFVLHENATIQLVTKCEEFLREVGAGTNAHGLPTPIAHWLDAAHRAGTTVERATALVQTVEATWRLLGCVLVSAFWSARKRATLDPGISAASWPAWRAVTVAAAESLRTVEGRVGELAEAICQAAVPGAGALDIASRRAMSLSTMLASSSRDERVQEQATTALELSIHEVFAALRCLRGWSLVAVRDVEALDAMGMASHVDYVDFTGPHALGVERRHTVSGIRVHPFVYLVRWAEGLVIPLEPLVRRVRAAGTNGDGLVIVENIPTAPGLHGYMPVSWEGRIEQHVTARQLAR